MRSTAVVVALVLMFGIVAHAAPPASVSGIPEYVNYQGRLVAPSGLPYSNTTHTVELRLYDSAGGGNKVWAERYSTKTQDGYFSILMGSGGTQIDGLTNKLWKVLWKEGAGSDNFYLGLTVVTDAQGSPLSSPTEATPRQQFLSSPFAYRAHQSVYATKASELFDAAKGIQTPSITSTGEVAVSKNMRLGTSQTLFANSIGSHGAGNLTLWTEAGHSALLLAEDGEIAIGNSVPYIAAKVSVGYEGDWYYNGSHTVIAGAPLDLVTDGGTINMDAALVRVNGAAPFVHKYVVVNLNGGTAGTASTGISATDYDQMVVGWVANQTAVALRCIYVDSGTIYVFYQGNISTSVGVHVLGIRKSLM